MMFERQVMQLTGQLEIMEQVGGVRPLEQAVHTDAEVHLLQLTGQA